MNLLMLGGGGHGKVCEEVAKECYELVDFLDDRLDVGIGKLADYMSFFGKYDAAFVAIGNPQIRKKYTEELVKNGWTIATLISKQAIVSPSAVVEAGCVVMGGAVIQTGVRIRTGTIISAGAIVDHGANIGEYCHVNCGAIVHSMQVVDSMTKIDYGNQLI